MSDSGLKEVTYDLVHTARTWIEPMPIGVRSKTSAERVESTAFSALVMLDGDSGPGQIVVRRKSTGVEVETGGLHEVSSDQHDDPEARRLLDEVEQRVRQCQAAHADAQMAVPEFIKIFCRLIGADYELRLLATDLDGEPTGEGEDIAPRLEDAFVSAWTEAAR